jgi:hypothetical protein
MLGERTAAFVLVFLFGIALFAVFEGVLSFQASHCAAVGDQATGQQSPRNKPAQADQQADNGSHQERHETVSEPFVCTVSGLPTALRVFMNKNEGFVVGSFTGLLVLVTGWLVWATVNLWKASIEADRPWVGPVTVATCPERNPLSATIVIRNTGRRPALQMRIAHRWVLLDQNTAPTIPDPRGGVAKALFPNADDFYYPFHGRGSFTHVEQHRIETGTHVLWVMARIEYLDGRGDTHHTNICTRWDRGRRVYIPDRDNDAN